MINVTKSKFVLYVFRYYPTITGFCVIMTILLSGIVRSSAWADDSSRQRRFIYNSDAGNMFVAKRPPMKPEDLHSDIDAVANIFVNSDGPSDLDCF